MGYLEFRKNLKDFTVFSLNDINKACPEFHPRRLIDWQQKGYIKKVVRGYYIFSDAVLNEKVLFDIANKIYHPSYVSLETALCYYHLISESIYVVTSISTRGTCDYKTGIAEFRYHTVKAPLFFGYNLENNNGRYFKIASIEKTVLDFLYFNPHLKNIDDLASLRIDAESFLKQVNEKKFYAYLDLFPQLSLAKRANLFMEFIKHA